MSNPYYNHVAYPAFNAAGSSANMRQELNSIAQGFDKLPVLSGASGKVVIVAYDESALVATSILDALEISDSVIEDTPIGAVTPAAGWFTTLSASGAVLLGSNVGISGGSIDGTAIGATTPAAGAFTTLSANSGITGNLTGNVTGNLTGNVTGNVTGNLTGNVTAASGTSSFTNVTINGTLDMAVGTSNTITGLTSPTNSSDAATKGYVDAADALKLNLSGGTMSGAIAMGANKITGLADPTLAQDAATKTYVDNAVQGLDAKASSKVATTANITLSGTQTIDGVAVVAGDRVLVKDQSSAAQNGIYVVAAGAWSRATDADTWDALVAAFTFVERGTTNGNNGYVCTVTAGGTLGTTAVTWVQFSGAGQVVAGAGLSKVANTLNVGTASSARIVVNSDDIDLAATGISAGTYRSLTIDTYGRATAGTNPTTLSGYGITDAYTTTQVDTALALKLSLSGGTMSGAIAMGTNKITGLGNPTNAQDAATKNYIDTLYGSTASAAASASAAAASEVNAAASAISASGSASAALTSANDAAASYDAFDDRYLGSKTSDPTLDNDGNPLLEGALYWNSVTKIMKVYDGSTWSASYLPATGYLPVSGGTMTGTITFSGAQTFPGVLALAGGTMSGAIAMGTSKITGMGDPAVAQDAATKNYVDTQSALKLSLTGGTMSGAIAMGTNKITGLGTPTATTDATTKTYVDTADALKLNLTGGTMSGAIAMGTSKITGMGDPTLAQDAATKNYVDTADALKLNLSGGTVTGDLTVTGALYANGSQRSNIVAVSALNIACSSGNYFTKTISGASSFTFSNAPASRAYSFTLELTVTSGSASWPAAVKWPGDTAPTLATGKTSLLMFVTDDGGTRWRGASLADYTT